MYHPERRSVAIAMSESSAKVVTGDVSESLDSKPPPREMMRTRRWIYTATVLLMCLQSALFVLFNVSPLTLYNNRTMQGIRVDSEQSVRVIGNGTQIYSELLDLFMEESKPLEINLTPQRHELQEEPGLILTKAKRRRPKKYEREPYMQERRIEPQVNCHKLFTGDKTELESASNLLQTNVTTRTPDAYIGMTKNCSNFKLSQGYITSSLTDFEAEFPIAFSIILVKAVEQAERLLRAIYRPQNTYCIHVDKNSEKAFLAAITAIVGCFDNVIMTSRNVAVKGGQFSIVEANLICMEELWRKDQRWKYYINLSGQEFPLKTNYELVRILKAYNGANDIAATGSGKYAARWKSAGPPPHQLTAVKGSIFICATRSFVDYVLHNNVAKDLISWSRNTKIPGETVFATLNHNPQLGIKGSYLGSEGKDDVTSKSFLARFVKWKTSTVPCQGKDVRGICIFTARDLQKLSVVPYLFAKAFRLDTDRFAVTCMEELLFNRTREEYLEQRSFDTRVYENVGFVKKQLL